VRRIVVALALAAACISQASAETHAERCAKYRAELAEIEKAKSRGGSAAHLHKLEAKRQKVLAAQAKHRC
jgi:hypothetical protein